jgi:hypothetical protein
MSKKKLSVVLCACLLLSFLVYEMLYTNQPVTPLPSPTNKPADTETDPVVDDPSEIQDINDSVVPPTDSPDTPASTADVYQNPPEVPINTDDPPPPHVNEVDHEVDGDYIWNSSDVIDVGLNDDLITVSSASAATVDGGKVTITSAGTYRLNGSLTDGQVIVNTEDKETVRLILNNVAIHCSASAPIYVMKARKTIIVLEQDTHNTLTDGSLYTVDSNEEPNGAIFSKSDLTICGEGALNVQANYNDGIASKDGLIIKSGQITVNAVDDAIRGKDYLIIKNGSITITAGGDGLKSDNTGDVTRGYVTIENGVLQIAAGRDAIDAKTDFLMKNGQITAFAGGGSSNNVIEGTSTKGIKAIVDLVIENGTIAVDSSDDAIHSNGTLTINSGTFNLATNDDGIHADESLTIEDGTFVITKSFEGLESSVITINGGTFHLASRDDGINIAGGNDGSGSVGDTFVLGSYHLYINGGYIYVNADGDGLDSNGAITMTDGQVIIDGPTSRFNTAIDHDPPRRGGGFNMTGGYILAVGSSGTQIAPPLSPDSTSTQYCIMVAFYQIKPASTVLHLRTRSGSEIFTFKPIKDYQNFVFCSPVLTLNTNYAVYTGGSSTGTITDGLYTGGTYKPGMRVANITITSILTKVGPPPPRF